MDLNVQRIEGCLRSYYVTYCGSSILIRRAWKSCYIWLMMQDPKYYIAEYYEAACKNICIEAYEELKKRTVKLLNHTEVWTKKSRKSS